MNHYNISVIVPIYKGKKYLRHLTDILDRNFYLFNQMFSGENEVLFINDDPTDKLGISDCYYEGTNLKIHMVNLDTNHGIHGARVSGLRKAKGDYIVFLDQDDEIEENYIVSQCEKIGNADAVLCNGYMSKYLMPGVQDIYLSREAQRRATDLQSFWDYNPIVSPGQMMIRKNRIPGVWTENIIKGNGVDDYCLWIAMLKEGRTIGINEEKLYIHIGHGRNTSSNTREMWKSKKEMITILMNHGYLLREEYDRLQKQLPAHMVEQEALRYNRICCLLDFYDQWMYLKNRNKGIKQYLEHKGYKKVAIYGMGRAGYQLYDELRFSDVNVLFGIDRNADAVACHCGLEVGKFEDLQLRFHELDVILVSIVNNYEEILNDLSNRCRVPIIALKDIFTEMIEACSNES